MFKRKQCTACVHASRAAIDRELRAGAGGREVAGRYGLSKSAIARHSLLHLSDDGSPEPDVTRQLLDSAQRALRRAEARGKHRDVMEALRVLGELRRRHRISSAASSPSASQPEQPHEERHDVDWLCERLKEIYGIRGSTEEGEDARLIAMLKARVMRDDCDAKIAAVCTLAASLIAGRPLDQESKTEVRRLLEVGDEVEIVGVVDDEVEEQIGTECDGSYDGDDEPPERSDSEPE
jgi:hypothetical protein